MSGNKQPEGSPLAFTWLDTADLRGLLSLFNSWAKMEGPTTVAGVAWWGRQAAAAVNSELLSRTVGSDLVPLPPITALTDTELKFIGASLGPAYNEGGEGLQLWVQRLSDVAVSEVTDRIERRGGDDNEADESDDSG